MTMNRWQLRYELADLIHRLDHGCGNNGCVIKKPSGMATNRPCSCMPRKFSEVLLDLASDLEAQRVWPSDTEVKP